MTTPPITLANLKAELLEKVRTGQIGKWCAFAEFVTSAHNWLPNLFDQTNIHAHIRWAADQMDDLEREL